MKERPYVWLVIVHVYPSNDSDRFWIHVCKSYEDAQRCMKEEYNSTKEEDLEDFQEGFEYSQDEFEADTCILQVDGEYTQTMEIEKEFLYDPEDGLEYHKESEPYIAVNFIKSIFGRQNK